MGRPHERVAAHSPHQGPHRQGDKAKDKAEQHYIAAGQYLKELKDDCPDQKTFLEKVEKEVGIGKSRTYELLQIGDGSKTVAGVRADTAKRVAKHEQSCPLANGQNADTPEASAEAMKAKFADNEAVIEAPAGRDLDLDRLREAWESACESAREAFRLNATFDIGAEDSAPAISERIFSELGVKKTERIVALLRKRLKAIDPNCRLCKGTGFTQILEFRGPCGGKEGEFAIPCPCDPAFTEQTFRNGQEWAAQNDPTQIAPPNSDGLDIPDCLLRERKAAAS